MHVVATRPANEYPAASFTGVTTALRYQPFVDLQSRGFSEAQSDVTVRGGVFENTGFRVGAVNLLDPQTGHYFAELPIDPAMLDYPALLVGPDNALQGFNSTVATVRYDWTPVRSGGIIEAGVGSNNLNFQRLLLGEQITQNLSIQAATARSEGDGTVENGDHKFTRHGLRLQYASQGQTDLYLGYQDKFHGWPGMYTGSAAMQETDDYQTLLVVINHQQDYSAGWWSAGAYYRKLDDDYELDRDRPGFFRPYEHKTEAYGVAAEGRHDLSASLGVNWRAEAIGDEIESTDLTHAGFMSRSYAKATVLPEWRTQVADGELRARLGASVDYSNRDNDDISPIAGLEFERQTSEDSSQRYFITYARTTQVAGYTALGSNPGPGAFAGNPDLVREVANTYETGAHLRKGAAQLYAAAFFRQDHNLVDWTFDSQAAQTLRQANAVDLETWGFESYAAYSAGKARVTLGYAYLHKNSDYEIDGVDASFYALNFPEHRATFSLQWFFLPQLELTVDAEARRQEKNVRRTSDNEALIVAGGITWRPVRVEGLALALLGDNLTNSDYQEFPGAPADGRQIAFRVSYSW